MFTASVRAVNIGLRIDVWFSVRVLMAVIFIRNLLHSGFPRLSSFLQVVLTRLCVVGRSRHSGSSRESAEAAERASRKPQGSLIEASRQPH
jgi:hypothetical protein